MIFGMKHLKQMCSIVFYLIYYYIIAVAHSKLVLPYIRNMKMF